MIYVPSHFAMPDEEAWALIERHPFGLLLSVVDGLPFATHLPFIREGDGLAGHLARANPQAAGLDGIEAVAVFRGVHEYISPAWYGDGPAVPTWNYEAVHATGRVRLVEGEELLGLLERSVSAFDREGWEMEEGYARKLLAGVVGFRLERVRLVGKSKLNQNQSAERRERVMGKVGGEMAARMRSALEKGAKMP